LHAETALGTGRMTSTFECSKKWGDYHSCEVGCLLNAAYWRRGFMSEALGLLFAHASTLGVTCLTADIDADNVRSIALFEKLGFKAHAGRYQRTLPFI
ncbi:GNAT family N-acetyltransferase, partial [Aeromonas veronii]